MFSIYFIPKLHLINISNYSDIFQKVQYFLGYDLWQIHYPNSTSLFHMTSTYLNHNNKILIYSFILILILIYLYVFISKTILKNKMIKTIIYSYISLIFIITTTPFKEIIDNSFYLVIISPLFFLQT